MNQIVFIELINFFKDKVFCLVKRLLISIEEVEDVIQEVMVKLWNKKDNLEGYNSIEVVVMIMIKNYCLDQLKFKRVDNFKIVYNNFMDRQFQLDKKIEDVDSLEWVEKIIG